jgi:hypothetical protein
MGWRKVRAARLAMDPFRCECGEIATEVDHIDDTDYQDHSERGPLLAQHRHDEIDLHALPSLAGRRTAVRRRVFQH